MLTPFLEGLLPRLTEAGVFGACRVEAGGLVCEASGSAAPASYRLFVHDGQLWVSLEMADRWQSESIESDLVHSGDKLDELIEEELVDLGWSGEGVRFEHFRSDDLLFTFRSPTGIASAGLSGADAERALTWLLGYEATFRQLGDMDGGDDDE